MSNQNVTHRRISIDTGGPQPSQFMLSIARHDKRLFFCFTEALDNPGRSITNSAEVAIATLIKKFDLDDLSDVRFFERYLPHRYGGSEEETFDEILYEPESGRVAWKHLSLADHRRIFGEPAVMGWDGYITVGEQKLDYNGPQEINFKPGENSWNGSKS